MQRWVDPARRGRGGVFRARGMDTRGEPPEVEWRFDGDDEWHACPRSFECVESGHARYRYVYQDGECYRSVRAGLIEGAVQAGREATAREQQHHGRGGANVQLKEAGPHGSLHRDEQLSEEGQEKQKQKDKQLADARAAALEARKKAQ